MLLIKGRPIDALGYYFDTPADEPDDPARYSGGVARGLDLEGRLVCHDEFRALLNDPSSPLNVEGVPIDRRKFAFHDALFALPKSVSLLFALSSAGARDQVVRAHAEARDQTLAYLEHHGAWVQEPTGERRFLRADGMLWAAFTHHVTRSGDPHLHSHVLIANRVPSSARGWSTLELRSLLGERDAASALHAASLRHELARRLGVGFRDRSAPNSDVAGFSDRVIDSFSSRSAEISRNGGDSFKGRSPKLAEPEMAQLLARWREEALHVGEVLRGDAEMTAIDSSRPFDHAAVDELGSRVAAIAKERAARFRAPFFRGDLVVAVCNELSDGAPVSVVNEAVQEAISELELYPEDPARRAQDRSRRPRRLFANEQVRRVLAVESRPTGESAQARLSSIATGGSRWPIAGEAFQLETIATPLSTYALVRSLRAQAALSGLPLLLHAPTAHARSVFEGATGLVSGGLAPRRAAAGGLTVVVDAWSYSDLDRTELVADATARGRLVLVLDRKWRRAPGAPTRLEGSPSAGAAVRNRVQRVGASVEVHFVDTLDDAIDVVSDCTVRFGDLTEVRSDWRLRPLLGSSAQRPSQRERRTTDSPLVVLGDASLIGSRDVGRRRVHVVVRSPDALEIDEAAIACVVAGWAIASRSGPRELPISERLAWGWRELVRGRERSERSLEHSGPEWVAMSRSQGQSREPRSEHQHGLVGSPVRDEVGR